MSVTDVHHEAVKASLGKEFGTNMIYSTKHFRRVGNPRLYDHPYPSPQLPLWEPGEVEWYVILRCAPPARWHKRRRSVVLQLPLREEPDAPEARSNR